MVTNRLKAELEGLLERERIGYATLTSSHPNVEIMDQETEIPFDLSSTTESKLQCAFCNAFCFASTIECKFCMPGTIACFDHIDQV